ncbi:MAG: PLP-dependent cysteine synthase family protein [Candidatus Thorarchaeota archaeon]|nr:PLP-dependent cysteine synthase family protein [Candidatus Thorarchaeota archaeon]
MQYYENISQLIGRTPLIKINKLNPYPENMILAKLEWFNPGGSVKDRVAKSMIDDAEVKGLLTLDKIIIEPTSGNTGIGLAMLSSMRGYRCELVMPESMSVERRKIMMAYGARVTLTLAEEGTDGAREYVKRKVAEEPGKYFSPNQYDNPANWLAHYKYTSQEILEATNSKVTHFVAGLGTSGTLMGMARGLKECLPAVKIVSVEPESDSFIQGLRDLDNQDVPGIFDDSFIDQRLRVSENDVQSIVRALSQEEGLFIGQSSGAAMWGAITIAKELHESNQKDSVIVVLLPDSGQKYISGDLFVSSTNVKETASVTG